MTVSEGKKLDKMFWKKKIIYVAVPERELSDISAEKLLLELKQDLNDVGSVLSDRKLGELKGKITGIEFMISNADKATLIINGGNALNDCPTDWEENANAESEGDFERPTWKFDCGLKLDYDGAILRVTSRFYPPKSHYGKTWDGTVTVCIFDKEVHEEKFDCETLEQLKDKVEKYTKGLRAKIEGLF